MSKYHFSNEIENKEKGFRNYLLKSGYVKTTTRDKSNYAGYYLNWLSTENLQEEEARYNDIISFMEYCHTENLSKKLINDILQSIRNYYQYLQQSNPQIINPARNLRVRGIVQKVPSNIISSKELEKFYQNYDQIIKTVKNTNPLINQRNKVILGLLVYQALTTNELHRLELVHLKLKKGKIYVPGNRRSNSRLLELKSFQILELQEYVTDIRPQLLKKPTDHLFLSLEGNSYLNKSLYHLVKVINKIHPEISSIMQIRPSVIIHWLKHYNLRQVQYMAGHKHVQSTERYMVNNLETLKKNLEKYHPLK